MGIKYFKPTTPARRQMATNDFAEITKTTPEKSLVYGKKRISCRDHLGHISIRRRGGGAKRKYRMIDFKRDKKDMPGTVVGIEYDPNRSANLALIQFQDGEKRYILAPLGLLPGAVVWSGDSVKSALGNSLPLQSINIGSFIHNIEINPGRGGQLARSAGTYAKLLGRDGNYVSIEMPSGEVRLILGKCYATVGEIGNKDHQNISGGKAGRSRWLGKRPRTRAVAMNPVDHPMGGGEGKSSGGRHPVSHTGVLAKGKKTRNKKKYSKRLILRRRTK